MRAVLIVFYSAVLAGAAPTPKQKAPAQSQPPGPQAQTPVNTSDVIATSGTRSSYRYVDTDLKGECKPACYVSNQTLTLRGLSKSTVHALIWARGISGFSFTTGVKAGCNLDASSGFEEVQIAPGATVERQYRICTAKASAIKSAGSLFVSADGLVPENIPISVETPEGWDNRLLTTAVNSLSVLLAFVLGIFSFLAQQWYQHWREQEKIFQDNIATNASGLRKYFTNDYPDDLGRENEWDKKRVEDFRKRLVECGVYRILRPADMDALDRAFEGECTLQQRTVLIRILERNFGQFINSNG
jgi:hypothetical protein